MDGIHTMYFSAAHYYCAVGNVTSGAMTLSCLLSIAPSVCLTTERLLAGNMFNSHTVIDDTMGLSYTHDRWLPI